MTTTRTNLTYTTRVLRRPTSWQRVCQDEPLDPIPSIYDEQSGDAYEDGVIATGGGVITITFPPGCNVNVGDTLSVTTGTSTGIYVISTPRSTMGTFGHAVETVYRYHGYDQSEAPVEEQRDVPFPRNGQERKILQAIGTRLGAEIARAERTIGRADGTSEWNHRFFEFVSRKKSSPSHASEGRRPRGSR